MTPAAGFAAAEDRHDVARPPRHARASARRGRPAHRRGQGRAPRVARAARVRRARRRGAAGRGVRAGAARAPAGCEPRALLRAAQGRAAAYARAAEARQQILSAPLPRGLAEELDELWREVGARSPWGFAVRSSATCEDGALVSMAGLAESVLGVRGDGGARRRGARGVGVDRVRPRARLPRRARRARRRDGASSSSAWSRPRRRA